MIKTPLRERLPAGARARAKARARGRESQPPRTHAHNKHLSEFTAGRGSQWERTLAEARSRKVRRNTLFAHVVWKDCKKPLEWGRRSLMAITELVRRIGTWTWNRVTVICTAAQLVFKMSSTLDLKNTLNWGPWLQASRYFFFINGYLGVLFICEHSLKWTFFKNSLQTADISEHWILWICGYGYN